MKLVFLGTPRFAVPTLEKLVETGHEVLCVVTQPDRPKGRGGAISFSPVKESALRHGLPIYQPERIRRPEAQAFLAGLHAEIMVVVGYGQIIPQSVIDIPPRGIVNLHASLLPRYRGAAPIQWAIVNGESTTGVTTMRIDAGLDTGDMLLREEVAIGPEETSIELGERLSHLGAELLIRTLRGFADGSVVPEPQDSRSATYAPLLKKEDGRIDWRQPASAIHNRVRGLQPWPGAYTVLRGKALNVWRSRVSGGEADLPAGTLLPGRGIRAVCGEGTVLELLELQMEGRKKISGEAFAAGQRLAQNEVLGSNAH